VSKKSGSSIEQKKGGFLPLTPLEPAEKIASYRRLNPHSFSAD